MKSRIVWNSALWWHRVRAGSPPSTSVKWGSREAMPRARIAAEFLSQDGWFRMARD